MSSLRRSVLAATLAVNLACMRAPDPDEGVPKETPGHPHTMASQRELGPLPRVDPATGEATVTLEGPEGWEEVAEVENFETEAGYPVTAVHMPGTLTDTRQVGGGPPREDWLLAGAFVTTPRGLIIIKAVGPRPEIEPRLGEFFEGIATIQIRL